MYVSTIDKESLIDLSCDLSEKYHVLHRELWNRVIYKLINYALNETILDLESLKLACIVNMYNDGLIDTREFNRVRVNNYCFACMYQSMLFEHYSVENECELCPITWSKEAEYSSTPCCNEDSIYKKLKTMLNIRCLKTESHRNIAIGLATRIKEIEWGNTDA